jgi:hypothetical protein
VTINKFIGTAKVFHATGRGFLSFSKTLPDAIREYFANRFTWYSGELRLCTEAVDKSAGNVPGNQANAVFKSD